MFNWVFYSSDLLEMNLTEIQKHIICKRFWEKGEDFNESRKRIGFGKLHYTVFNSITNRFSKEYLHLYPKKREVVIIYKEKWLRKPDDNSTLFSTMTEEEIFDRLCKQKGNAHNIKWNE